MFKELEEYMKNEEKGDKHKKRKRLKDKIW